MRRNLNFHATLKEYQGQYLWLKDYSRNLVKTGVLHDLVENNIITGIVLNSIALEKSIHNNTDYDESISTKLREGLLGEELAQEILLTDAHYVADRIRHVFNRSNGTNGWVGLPISPFIEGENCYLLDILTEVHNATNRPNVLMTLSWDQKHLETIEKAVHLGLPLNITNIISPTQLLDVTHACLTGMTKRITDKMKGFSPIFITIPMDQFASFLRLSMPVEQVSALLLTTSQKIYDSMKQFYDSTEWKKASKAGVKPPRLICNYSNDKGNLGHTLSLYNSPFRILALPKEIIHQLASSVELSKEISSSGPPCEYGTKGFNELAVAAENHCRDSSKKNWMQMLETVARKSAQISQSKNFRCKQI